MKVSVKRKPTGVVDKLLENATRRAKKFNGKKRRANQSNPKS